MHQTDPATAPRPVATSNGWWPLNAIDCSIHAATTDRTKSVRPRRTPEAVREPLHQIVQLTQLYRDQPRPLHRLFPEPPKPVGDPDDFPLDPLGICLWPWRQALWRVGWDAWIARVDHPRTAVLLIGVWPDAGRREAAFG